MFKVKVTLISVDVISHCEKLCLGRWELSLNGFSFRHGKTESLSFRVDTRILISDKICQCQM